jgi:DNA-directed RNA polymerase specialized sigma24 family protein
VIANPPAPEDRSQGTSATLGDLLYADKTRTPVSESEWVELVQSIAAGDGFALRSLYERTHRLVFTLIMRLIHDRETAEELALDVFHDVWRWASKYDAAGGTVVGWVMNEARSRAGVHIRSAQRSRRVNPHIDEPLRPAIDSFAFWQTDLLRPSTGLWERLAERIAAESGQEFNLAARTEQTEPDWPQVAPGISCKLLATDAEKHRVSMLVRLAPGVAYPPHRHAGVEELHLLCGELWIDDRKLDPGDYSRAEPGTADARVWSETGCTCVLITSPLDELR